MIEEALEFLARQAQSAVAAKDKVEVLRLPGEDDSKFAIAKPDGSVEVMTARPRPVKSTLLAVDEIPDYCEWLIDRGNARPTVWYDEKGVQIVHDDAPFDRQLDVTTIPLTLSDQLKRVRLLIESPSLSQRDLVRMLRVELCDCLGELGAEFLRTVRSIDFRNFVTGHSDLGHGRQSLGKEIEQEVVARNGSAIPEELVLTLPCYTDRALRDARRPIRLAVEIEPQSQKFILSPLAGEIDKALAEEMEAVRSIISPPDDVNYLVFYGRP